MTEHSRNDVHDAAGCLENITLAWTEPSRAGMGFLEAHVLVDMIAAGGTAMVFGKGNSAEPFVADLIRLGRKRNDKPAAQVKAGPYYRQFDKRR